MADCSSLIQNVRVVKEENVAEKFPYRVFNDLSKKLKAAEATIANMLEREALHSAKDDVINNLKQKISDLTYENNRYHLAISYCTVCTSDDEFSDAYYGTQTTGIWASLRGAHS